MSEPRADPEPIVLRGVLGWGNRKTGLEAYGPGGRWAGATRDGDLLGDALYREGAREGAALVVVAIPAFRTMGKSDARDAIFAAVEAVVRYESERLQDDGDDPQ